MLRGFQLGLGPITPASSGGGGGGGPTTPNAGYYTGANELLFYAKHSSYEEDTGTTLVTADGQSIGFLTDFSGNSRNAVQATAGSRPTRASHSGVVVAETDGADILALAADIDTTDTEGVALYAVLWLPAATSKFLVGALGNGTRGYLIWSDGKVYVDASVSSANAANNISIVSGSLVAVRWRRQFENAAPGDERKVYFASSASAEVLVGTAAGVSSFGRLFGRTGFGGQDSDASVGLAYLHLIHEDITSGHDATEAAYISSEFGVSLPAF